MAELKPCPFCGKIPIIENCKDFGYFVKCKCGIEQSTLYAQRCDAVKRWNKRKTEPQTYVINPQEPTNDDKCFECDDFFTCGGQCNKIEDEPQKPTYNPTSVNNLWEKPTSPYVETMSCQECKHWLFDADCLEQWECELIVGGYECKYEPYEPKENERWK